MHSCAVILEMTAGNELNVRCQDGGAADTSARHRFFALLRIVAHDLGEWRDAEDTLQAAAPCSIARRRPAEPMRVETLSSSWGCGLPYDLVSLVPSAFQMVKHAARHGHRELVLSHEHGTEVRATQQRGFFIGMGAEQDPDARVQRSGDLDHLPDPRRVRGAWLHALRVPG
jgi:hypothetical protein